MSVDDGDRRSCRVLSERKRCRTCIGGFRDTNLGRQVVSRPGGSTARMWSAGGLASAASSPSGVWGGAPSEIDFDAFLALKVKI